MKRMWTVRALLCMLSVALPGAAQEAVSWGNAVNGLRLGLNMRDLTARDQIRVVFQNVGTTAEHVLLGEECNGRTYGVRFSVKDGKSDKCDLVDYGQMGPCAGMVAAIMADLAPGESTEVVFDAKKLVCMRTATGITLKALLQQGYKLELRFDVKTSYLGAFRMGDGSAMKDAWLGSITAPR